MNVPRPPSRGGPRTRPPACCAVAGIGLAGCAPAIVDFAYENRHERAVETCRWEEYRRDAEAAWGTALEQTWWDSRPIEGLRALPSPRCVERVLADFAVDEPALLHADARLDPFLLTREAGAWDRTRTGALLTAARALLVFEWPPVEAVEASALTSPRFVAALDEVAAETGAETVGQALYDLATTVVTTTTPGFDEDAVLSLDDEGTLYLHPYEIGGGILAAGFAHEGAHALGAVHEPCVADPDRECDPDVDGAYGFQIAVLVQAWKAMRDEDVRQGIGLWVSVVLAHVGSFQDQDGVLDPAWQDGASLDLSAY